MTMRVFNTGTKNIHQNMKDFIIQTLPEPGLEVGKGALGGDIVHGNAGIGSVCATVVFIPQNCKKLVHALVSVNIPEQLQQKKRCGIIWRRTFHGVAVSCQ